MPCGHASGEPAMHCPYCAEDIKDEAVVCKHCHRDLYIAKPLLEKLNEMSKRVRTLEATAEQAELVLAGGKHRSLVRHPIPTLSAVESIALIFILLVLAHFLIIVYFDLKLIYLRIVSIFVPFIFGFLCRESEKNSLLKDLLLGIAIAIVSIATMTAIVAKLDKVAFLPETAYEWRENAIYSASIAFGFVTGVIARQTVIAFFSPGTKANKVIDMIARTISNNLKHEGKTVFTFKLIRTVVSTVLGVGSAVISIVSGLWGSIMSPG